MARDPRELRDFSYQVDRSVVPQAGGGEVSSLLQRLSSFSRQLEESRARKVNSAATRAGAIDGGTVDFQRREGSTMADQAFNEAGLRAHESFLSNNIRIRMDDLADEHRLNPQSFMDAVGIGEAGPTGKGYLSKMTSEVDPELRANLSQDIAARASFHFRKLTADQRGRLADSNRAAFLADLDGFHRDIGRASREGDEQLEEAAFQGFFRALDGATGAKDAEGIPTSDPYMTDEDAQQYIQKFKDMSIEERLLGEFERTGDKTGFLRTFQAGPDKRLRTDQIDKLTRKFTGVLNREARVARAAQAEHRAILRDNGQKVDRLTTLLNAGVELDDDAEKFLDDVRDGRVPVESDYIEKVVIAHVGKDVVADVTRMPVADAEAQVAELSARPRTDLVTAKLQDAAQDALGKLKDGLGGDDPTGWALQRGVGTAVDLDFSNPQLLRASLQAARASADQQEATYHQPFSPLTKAQRDLVTSTLASMPAERQVEVLGEIQSTLGDRAHLVFEDLAKSGAPTIAHAGWLGSRGKSELASSVLAGRAALQSDAVKQEPAETASTAWVSSGLAAVLPPSVANQVLAAAQARLADLRYKDPTTSVDLKQALDEVAGVVDTYKGKSILLPLGVPDSTTFASAVEGVTDEDVRAMGGSPGAAEALRSGQALLQSVGDGKYAVRVGVTMLPFLLDYSKITAKPARSFSFIVSNADVGPLLVKGARVAGKGIDAALETGRAVFHNTADPLAYVAWRYGPRVPGPGQ